MSNLEDLLSGSFYRRSSMDGEAAGPPRCRGNPLAAAPTMGGDASVAAELLLELYQAHSGGTSDLLIMLSQLQVRCPRRHSSRSLHPGITT